MARVGSALLLSTLTRTASAQLPNTSTAAFAMGSNFTAIARGFEAVAWNPANLAMPGRPGFSLGVAALGGVSGFAPIDLMAMHAFSGQVVDSATRVSWIDQARLAGGQRGRLDAGVTYLALSAGPIGVQVGSSAYMNLNLSPDAWEAVLFGNAGRTGGQPKTLDFTGTSIRTAAFTTGALSFALPIAVRDVNALLPNEHAAIGITGKYIVGHGVVVSEDEGSALGSSDFRLRFPVIAPGTSDASNDPLPAQQYRGKAGTGVGADLSIAWSVGVWRLGVLAENVFNTFKWDTKMLAFRPGTGTFNADSSAIDWDRQAYNLAPQTLRDIVERQRYRPSITVGAAVQVTRSLTITSDTKIATGGSEAIVIGPRSRIGVGAEWRGLAFLPLRAGVASVADGWQAGAGLGLRCLGYELGVASTVRHTGAAKQSGIMVGLVGVGR